ncbi:hypothetical protein PUN28_016995 [Cardiocondyla obscurior]|uniref:RNA-directed DNA polymerase n=1 Tax=Cardiocondyla obscurior TaxID=286306 RepID=A0AAW2EP53_9HYME
MNIDISENDSSIIKPEIHVNPDLPHEVKARVQNLFEANYVNAVKPPEPATENIFKLTLIDEKPFFCSPRRLSYHEKAELRTTLDNLMSKKVIRESTSEYASPIVLTKKKNGETRMCVDYRTLNKVTARDNFPLPLIEDQLDLLTGKKYFTTLDLKDGFYHVRMHENSVKYTSFVTPLVRDTGNYLRTSSIPRILAGNKVKIITDCQALNLTLLKKETNPRIARWVLEMQNYDYVLEHRPGSRMQHVDALSRQITVVEDNTFDRNLALCQSEDQNIASIRNELEHSEQKLFEMRNGLVYRKHCGQVLFYVPIALEPSVMHKYHNEMGHVGIEKTVRNIMSSYWFPEIKTKVKNHIKNCLKCVAFTPDSRRSQGSLHSIPKGDAPFSTLHVDHLALTSRSNSSAKHYIFLVVDAFTKHVKLYATKTTNAAEVIKNLKTYFEY